LHWQPSWRSFEGAVPAIWGWAGGAERKAMGASALALRPIAQMRQRGEGLSGLRRGSARIGGSWNSLLAKEIGDPRTCPPVARARERRRLAE
jgi:hypothetical protein